MAKKDKKGRKKEVVHIHYVHHIYHVPPQAAAPIMVHAAMPGQPHADIMTAPGFHAPEGYDPTPERP